MAAYVLDTSAVVKRYILEAGTVWVRSIADPAASHLIYLARITDVEVTSAVVRRQRGGNLSAPDAAATLTQFRQDLIQGYRIIEITPGLLSVARSLRNCGDTIPNPSRPWGRTEFQVKLKLGLTPSARFRSR
jgi:uncharacterized protein